MADTVEDGYEPDNSFTEYSSMTVTTSLQSQYRSIMPMYDGDYIQFSASPGMYIFNGSSTIDIYCSIYDENYNYLAGGALQSGISYVIYNSGSYFLTVYGYDAIGDYALNYVYEPFLGSLRFLRLQVPAELLFSLLVPVTRLTSLLLFRIMTRLLDHGITSFLQLLTEQETYFLKLKCLT